MKKKKYEWEFIGKLKGWYIFRHKVNKELMKTNLKKAKELTPEL